MKHAIFVTRMAVHDSHSGGGEYTRSFVSCLESLGWTVRIIHLNPVHNFLSNGWLIPRDNDGAITYRFAGYRECRGFQINVRALLCAPILRIARTVRNVLNGRFFTGSLCRNVELSCTRFSLPSIVDPFGQWFQRIINPDELAFCKRVFDGFTPDVAIVNYLHLGPLLEEPWLAKSCKKMILAHDCWHLRVANFKSMGLEPDIREWSFEEEKKHLLAADHLIHISEAEHTAFKSMLGEVKPFCWPMPLEWNPLVDEEIEGRCMFVASCLSVNITGIEWFLETVWPLVLHELPYATLTVCGDVCHGLSNVDSSIHLMGRVDSLEEYYRLASVVVVPILSGGGVKIKTLEALKYGKAIVATSVGMHGIPRKEECGAVEVDCPEQFARVIVEFLSKPEARATARAKTRDWIQQHMSLEIQKNRLAQLLES